MTRADAVAAAERERGLFGLTMTVYRLPAWPPDVYGVRAAHKLPHEAQRFETFDAPPVAGAPTPPVIAVTTLPDDPQGNLFG